MFPSSMVSSNRKVQEVCVEALKFLRSILPRLAPPTDDVMVSSDLKECREMALFLLAAFWYEMQIKILRYSLPWRDTIIILFLLKP